MNEHIVPQAYLQNFAPDEEGLISRYSLIDKHEGDDYYPPRDRYPISKAASYEDFANGLLESGEANIAEREMIRTIRNILDGEVLSAKDVPGVSSFISFQTTRGISSRLYYNAKQRLPHDEFAEGVQDWSSAISYNTSDGHTLLQYMGWVLIENKTDLPFFTSDEPVVESQGKRFDNVDTAAKEMIGRQIFCPIGPDHLLLLLDPSLYDVDGLLYEVDPEGGIQELPDEMFTRIEVADRNEIWKFNLLQPLNAYREVFAPVGNGDYLEQAVEWLCSAFPDEDFVRGNTRDFEKMLRAYIIAASGPNSPEQREWYLREGSDVINSRGKKLKSLENFSHSISVISDLEVDNPDMEYWNEILDVIGQVPPEQYLDAESL
ncbi:DUF4238 domain-containing protein [Halomicrobium sp. IBSBa]|uniref:DUF4238 domain-containing protein n=1 Tax=Halomicrobium sp. IBSBa TaxID=2778916 RepID=UPI001ABF5801|nr:DUF4238 domain-containing protein [Halomicrobium sp. IBSBa]MBO4249479.1 DUF4238 domain-containing protein [Halomicrobium sp. IBSBa]